MKKLIIVILALGLSGCAGLFDDYGKYTDVTAAHSTAESQRISAQAYAIADAAKVEGATKTEAVLLSAIAMLQIERLTFVPLNINAPVTGFTVLNTVAGHIPFMSSTLGMYKLGEVAINNAGNIFMEAEQIDNVDSFNRTEVHATGKENTAGANADRDHSVTEEITTTNTNEGGGY